jgi:polyisoprenoid-binding protein YceI
MMISSVRGQFTGVTGTLTFDERDLSRSSVEASIEVATVNTHDPQRDAHLKSPDFFDVEKFPALTFRSTRVTRKSDGTLAVAGPLTIHGVTREVEFAVEGPTPPMKDPWGNTRIGVTATTKLNRTDFGLNFNAALETGGVLVGEDVTITLELEFVRA